MDALSELKTRDFRAVRGGVLQFDPGWNFFEGPNAQGKTSVLEAVAVLLRLQSPRTRRLADLIRAGAKGFVLDGYFGKIHLQFYYSAARKKLALDGAEQKRARDYLGTGSVVWFGNDDIRMARGVADTRRRFLDFLGEQLLPGYRVHLHDYERALRSRNRLLKGGRPAFREVAAFDPPLVAAGAALVAARARVVATLSPVFTAFSRKISGDAEDWAMTYACGVPGVGDPAGDPVETVKIEENVGKAFFAVLDGAREEDARRGQTAAGPHRDDLLFWLGGQPAERFASEGQQRTLVLALRAAEASVLAETWGRPPVLLLDDCFGELDPSRRLALLEALPAGGQRFLASTGFAWADAMPGTRWSVYDGDVNRRGGRVESGPTGRTL